MRDLLEICAILLAAFAVTAFALFVLDDTNTLTAPPESMTEGFMRQVASRRFERALPYLDDSLAAATGEDGLARFADELERRRGEIISVRGIPGETREESASSVAELETATGVHRIRCLLALDHHVWHIVRFSGP